MVHKTPLLLLSLVLTLPGLSSADDLTAIIQKDLASLGYDPGNLDGEATVPTIVAVSKFQAEHGMEVTGEITPQLAGVIKAAINQGGAGGSAPTAAPAPAAAPVAAPNPAALQAAQQACLQKKMADAQEAQKKKRGLRSLMRAVGNASSQFGASEVAASVAQASSTIYTAGAVASDLESAAKDLGLTESDLEACRNP